MAHLDFTNLSGKIGQVSQMDIGEGAVGDCSLCPVALGLNRMFPGYASHIEHPIALINDELGNTKVDLLMSQPLQDWIDAFDHEKVVSPIELVIMPIEDCDDDDAHEYKEHGIKWQLDVREPQTPITYHETPEEYRVSAIYHNGELIVCDYAWGTSGHLEGVVIDDVKITSMEALQARGIKELKIEATHSTDVDVD